MNTNTNQALANKHLRLAEYANDRAIDNARHPRAFKSWRKAQRRHDRLARKYQRKADRGL